MSKLTREMLDARRTQAKMAAAAQTRTVLICAGTGCIAGGSLKIYDYLKEECERRDISVLVNLMDDESQCAGHQRVLHKNQCSFQGLSVKLPLRVRVYA